MSRFCNLIDLGNVFRDTLPGFLTHKNTVFPFRKYTVYPILIFNLIVLSMRIGE